MWSSDKFAENLNNSAFVIDIFIILNTQNVDVFSVFELKKQNVTFIVIIIIYNIYMYW